MDDPCDICGEPLGLRWVGGLTGSSGPVTASFEQLPFRACPSEHYRAEIRPGFVDEVQAAAAEPLLVARRARLRGEERCGACGTGLVMPARAGVRPVTIVLDGLAPFTLILDLPLVRCPDCGLQQLPAKVARDHLSAAVAQALERRCTVK